MSRFVRPSKYRHVYGVPAKRDLCFDNVKPSRNANDCNYVKANPRFISLCWEASGGGAFAVFDQKTDTGKIAAQPNLFMGHKSAVLDIDFHPFDDYIIASGSEDTKINVWQIPEVINAPQSTPATVLTGHNKKVTLLQFHPTANNVLASVSADLTVRLWDIEKGQQRSELSGIDDLIQAISFSADGAQLAVTSKDKKLRIFDVRTGKAAHVVANHEGVKNQRVVWLGNSPRVATTGFSKTSDRQLIIRDINNFAEPLVLENVDTSSGVLMPFYDDDSKILFLAGKGDGNIRYFEMTEDKPWQFLLSQYSSNEPQRGMGWLPKRGVNVSNCEIARVYKLAANHVEPISFVVPRKSDSFQEDLFPDCISGEPALTSDEFFDGKTALPLRVSMQGGAAEASRKTFSFASASVSAPAAAAEEKPASHEGPRSVASKPVDSAPAAQPVRASPPPVDDTTKLELEAAKAEQARLQDEVSKLQHEVERLHEQLSELSTHNKELQNELLSKDDLINQLSQAQVEEYSEVNGDYSDVAVEAE
jgi:hypothetical protein